MSKVEDVLILDVGIWAGRNIYCPVPWERGILTVRVSSLLVRRDEGPFRGTLLYTDLWGGDLSEGRIQGRSLGT